ncbi:MAG TPA: TldD/PmbA family protein [bacterium]|nr:TldD/PmbA family protein [bacterium]
MIDEIPSEKILQAAMRSGADYAEIFVERTQQTTVVCDNRKLEHAASIFDLGVGIRVLSGDKTAYGSTNDLTRKGLLGLARSVARAASAKRKKAPPIVLAERRAPSVTTARCHPSGASLADKCAIVVRANEVAWQCGEQVRQVRILYRDRVRRIWVASSAGFHTSDEQVDTTFTAHVVAGTEGNIQTGYESQGGAIGLELFDEIPPEETAERAASRSIKLLSARQAPAGTMPVVLSAEAGGTMIHEAVGHGLEADIAGEGMSVYSGRIGQKVASEIVSVADDSTRAKMRGSFTFDDEGTPAGKTILIEDGVLKAYMSDISAFRKYGHPSTGNGRRQSYREPPIVRMTNTMILPGKDDPSSILSETASGLFVKKMGGGQVNTLNGDFVFEVQEGYLIEGGKRGELVRGAMLIGNGPKVLRSIDRVGSDLGFSIGTCGKDGQEAPVSCGQPTIRIPEIVVGGRS